MVLPMRFCWIDVTIGFCGGVAFACLLMILLTR